MQDNQYLASQNYSVPKFIFLNLFLFIFLSGLGVLLGTSLGNFETTNMVYILPIVLSGSMAIVNIWNRIKPDRYKALFVGILFTMYALSGAIHFELHLTGNVGTIIFLVFLYIIASILPFININLARKLFYLQRGADSDGNMKKQNYKLISIVAIIGVAIGRSSLLVTEKIDYRLIIMEIFCAFLAIIFIQSLSYQFWEARQNNKNGEME
jgi:hypothetical protein